jgi:hypothetical protein
MSTVNESSPSGSSSGDARPAYAPTWTTKWPLAAAMASFQDSGCRRAGARRARRPGQHTRARPARRVVACDEHLAVGLPAELPRDRMACRTRRLAPAAANQRWPPASA